MTVCSQVLLLLFVTALPGFVLGVGDAQVHVECLSMGSFLLSMGNINTCTTLRVDGVNDTTLTRQSWERDTENGMCSKRIQVDIDNPIQATLIGSRQLQCTFLLIASAVAGDSGAFVCENEDCVDVNVESNIVTTVSRCGKLYTPRVQRRGMSLRSTVVGSDREYTQVWSVQESADGSDLYLKDEQGRLACAFSLCHTIPVSSRLGTSNEIIPELVAKTQKPSDFQAVEKQDAAVQAKETISKRHHARRHYERVATKRTTTEPAWIDYALGFGLGGGIVAAGIVIGLIVWFGAIQNSRKNK
jgi:hypothetical protein